MMMCACDAWAGEDWHGCLSNAQWSALQRVGGCTMGTRLKVNTALVLMSLAEVGECVSHCCWMTASPAPSWEGAHLRAKWAVRTSCVILEARAACTTAQWHREYSKNEFEYWCVKSSIPVPCADPSLQCDSIVIIMLKKQVLFTCKLHDLREFTPYVSSD